MKLDCIKSNIQNLPVGTKFTAIKNNNGLISGSKKTERRGYKESEEYIFIYAKGRSKYGYRYSIEGFCNLFSSISYKTEEEENDAWHKRCAKVVTKLRQSGLWPKFVPIFENLQKMSLKDKRKIEKLYLNSPTWQMSKEEKKKLFGEFVDKYSFIFWEDEDSNFQINTSYFFELSDAKLKSMYFGWRNKEIKEEIKASLSEKKEKRIEARTSYDVIFAYKPDIQSAWYSEEYKGCGNGHYYLALDHNTAIFYEDD